MDRRLPAPFQDIPDRVRAVYSGLYIGHQNDRGISPSGSGGCAGLQVFFAGKAGIPEMRVRVDQTGRGGQAPGVNDPDLSVSGKAGPQGSRLFRRDGGFYGQELTVPDGDITDPFPGICRIDQISVLNQQHSSSSLYLLV